MLSLSICLFAGVKVIPRSQRNQKLLILLLVGIKVTEYMQLMNNTEELELSFTS